MHSPASAAPSLRTASSTYPGTLDQIRRVRADLRRVLDDCPIADDVILCASELATNAALHSNSRYPGGTYTVCTEISPGSHVRIEVEDDGGPWVESAPDATRGRGLNIIRALAADWGTCTTPDSRIVSARITWPDEDQPVMA